MAGVRCYSVFPPLPTFNQLEAAKAARSVILCFCLSVFRFVSRIQAERIHCIQETRATERLDMEQFQPMMTSEPRQPQHAPAVLVTSARTRRPRGKRECAVEELDEEGVRVPRKRERRWGLANNSYFSCISYIIP